MLPHLIAFRNQRLRNEVGLKANLIIGLRLIDADSRTLGISLSDGSKASYSPLIGAQTSEKGGVPPPKRRVAPVGRHGEADLKVGRTI